MLPDIKKPSGIGKTVQVNFGGVDLRPEAGDGTFCKTVNMTTDKLPLLASRPGRRVVASEGQIYHSDLYGMGDGIFENRDGFLWYNGVQIAGTDVQGGGMLIPFGNKIILPWSREIIDLTERPKGAVGTVELLPADAEEGDVFAIYQTGHFYKRVNGSWVDLGCMVQSLEASAALTDCVFSCGEYQEEDADWNTVENRNSQIDLRTVFRPGDAVTISGCVGQPRNNQTLIVREVQARTLSFYENSFMPYYLGRAECERLMFDGAGQWVRIVNEDVYAPTGLWIQMTAEILSAMSQEPEVPDMMVYYTPALFNRGANKGCVAFLRWDAGEEAYRGYATADTYAYDPDDPMAPPSEYEPIEISFETVLIGPKTVQPVLWNQEENPLRRYYEPSTVTIARKWPENIQGVFADSNRLWGWDGRQIRCCKLGDPSNWDFFDGTAEDSWAVEVHDPDPFTGGISVHGYPTFFTENKRYRVYGSEPEAYQLGEQDCSGVRAGCEKSLAAFDGALYYVSRAGIMRDTGDAPVCISEALGPLRLSEAVAGGNQRRYYVTGRDQAGELHNLILDTRNGAWIDEGSRNVVSYAAAAGVMHEAEIDEADENRLTIRAYETGSPLGDGSPEPAQSSVAETNDYTVTQPNRKRVHRVQLRFVIGSGSSLTVAIRYDSSGDWQTVKTVTGDGRKRSVYLPVLPRRCDHFRLRFTATGDWELHSLALDLRQGSAVF